MNTGDGITHLGVFAIAVPAAVAGGCLSGTRTAARVGGKGAGAARGSCSTNASGRGAEFPEEKRLVKSGAYTGVCVCTLNGNTS